MRRNSLILLAAAGSLALLLGALAFQYLGGLAPCELCIWQRWPHVAALLAGGAALALPGRVWPALGGLAALATAGLGLYHTGVERSWWEGPAACTGGADLSGLSGDALLNPDAASAVVMCDQVAWSLMGLSMASWNALASLALVGVWIAATVRA